MKYMIYFSLHLHSHHLIFDPFLLLPPLSEDSIGNTHWPQRECVILKYWIFNSSTNNKCVSTFREAATGFNITHPAGVTVRFRSRAVVLLPELHHCCLTTAFILDALMCHCSDITACMERFKVAWNYIRANRHHQYCSWVIGASYCLKAMSF